MECLCAGFASPWQKKQNHVEYHEEGTGISSHERFEAKRRKEEEKEEKKPLPAVLQSPGATRGCDTRDKAPRGRPHNLGKEKSDKGYRELQHNAAPLLESHNNRTPEVWKYLSGEWQLNEGQPLTFSYMKDPIP